MKRKIFSAIIVVALVFLVSCGQNGDLTFSGAYWNENHQNTSVSGIEEVLTYRVASVNEAEFSDSELKSDGLSLVVDEQNSSYVTKLYVDGGNYVYETTLTLNGKYVYSGGEYPVENDITYTKTVMKGLEERLFPVSAYQKAKNVFVNGENPTSPSAFGKISYEAEITYGEEAEIKITPESDSEGYFKRTEFKTGDYKKTTFLDSGAMVFAFRAMKFTDLQSYTLNTIDFSTGELREISVSAIKTDTSDGEGAVEQNVIPVSVRQYRDNGKLLEKKDFSCYGAAFETTGNYAKAFRYVYYAVNPVGEDGAEINSTRHVPVKIYQPEIYNTGYLCFTLEKFSANYN